MRCFALRAADPPVCALNPTLAAYTSGMVLHWKPDTAGAGGPTTLNIDTLGTKPLKTADGVSDPASTDISAGKLYDIWYDGSAFRLMTGAGGTSGGGSVASVFGRTGPVIALNGDYSTDQVTEGGNLYFTNPRTRAALSASAPITFNGSTGAIGCATCLTTGTTADTDLSGTFPHLSVTKVNGGAIPTSGLLKANSSGQIVQATAGDIPDLSATYSTKSGGNAMTGYSDFSGGRWRLPEATFASSPSSPQAGQAWLFTDASAAGTCAGGGSAKAQCRWTGSVWEAIGGGGGAVLSVFGQTGTVPNLSGDCATSGSSVVTCPKVNGTSVPTNSAADQVLGTTSSATGVWMSVANCVASGRVLRYSTSTHGFSCYTLAATDIPDLSTTYQPLIGSGSREGNGSKYQMFAGSAPTTNDCAKFDANGNIVTAGAACGSGGSGANALGFYLVNQATNEPANAVNLGALSTGLLKIAISAGVATASTASAGSDYQAPISGAPGTWPSFGGAALLGVGTTAGTVAAGDDSRMTNSRAPTAHNLLSASHGDTTASAAVRGGALFATGTSPVWSQVAHSAATGGYWKWNGTDVVASTGAAAGTGSCTNQVVTAGNADAAPSCSTVVAGMTDTSIAHTGVDVNTSYQVTATHLAAALPVAQGGTGATSIPTWNQSTSGSAAGITGKTFLGTATQVAQFLGTPAGSKCVHTDTNGNLAEASADCGSGGGATRTWPYVWQAAVQSGVTGFAVNLPAASAPTPTNSGGTMPIGVLEWPTAQSTYNAWWTWVLPAGYTTNAAISYSVESRCNPGTCDSTHANIMTLGLGCAGGAALDAPTIANASPVNITNGAAAIQTVTTGTLTPNSGGLPACAAGNRVWVRIIVDTNTHSLTGPFDLVSATFSVQGGM